MKKESGFLSTTQKKFYLSIILGIIATVMTLLDIDYSIVPFILALLVSVKVIVNAFLNWFPQVIFKGFHQGWLSYIRMAASLKYTKLPWNRYYKVKRVFSFNQWLYQEDNCCNKLFGISFGHHRLGSSLRVSFYPVEDTTRFIKPVNRQNNPDKFFKLGHLAEVGKKYEEDWSETLVRVYDPIVVDIEADFKLGVITMKLYHNGVIIYKVTKTFEPSWYSYDCFAYIGGRLKALNKLKITND